MGEYATYLGRSVKIGTCEDMLYLRADQAHLVQKERGSLDPVTQAGSIRFRFPFPQEDGTEPGAYTDPFYGLGVYGVTVPEGVDHHAVQFASTRPTGMLTSLPCPASKEGKELPFKVHYNGFAGPVKIVQQRLWEGKLVLVCECGCCGAKYRLPTIEDAEPIINALTAEVERMTQESVRTERPIDGRARYLAEVAKRIVHGYTRPNPWTPKETPAIAG